MVTAGVTLPASLPPAGLRGLDAAWSTLVTVPEIDDHGRTFHVLDTGNADAELTVLCVHGNPTWSYLWRAILARAGPEVRVVAPDHLDMGFSERTDSFRRLGQRIDDLDALMAHLRITGPVVTVAHDWGGPISLGWAARHRDQLAGIVLMNTAVHQPPGVKAPGLIRFARSPEVLARATVKTTAFIQGALRLSGSQPPADVREAFLAPYRTSARRRAIGDFVSDIPLEAAHPTRAPLADVAAGLADLGEVPALLLWGAADPIFADRFLFDLERRLPHAQVHRYADAGHLITEDVDVATVVHDWLGDLDAAPTSSLGRLSAPLWAGLEDRSGDDAVALVEMGATGPERTMTFAELATDVARIGAGLDALGVTRGDRVALLVRPGVDLTATIYACWRIGAVAVVADAGLGLRGIGRALASAAPDWLIGVTPALAAARTLRWPGTRIAAASLTPAALRGLGAVATLESVRHDGRDRSLPPPPGARDLAAIVFTSGATGPAKGVRYRHHQAQAQRDALMRLYGIDSEDRLVAAFAPFALYGPAMGIPSVVPQMDVTAPSTLTAAALGDAVAAIEATLVFASPAALTNVAATAAALGAHHRQALEGVRLMLSAGAPVAPSVLRAAGSLMPNAVPHTPYGMTEVLPVADISLPEIDAAGTGHGVCVGPPLDGVEVMIDPLDGAGRPSGKLYGAPELTGEVCIRAAHVRDGYDRRWHTQHRASQPAGWHRSGDVGHFDSAGRLWIEGRLVHVITTAAGPVTPVPIEHAVLELDDVTLAAAVGVGPAGTQQVVVVVARPDVSKPALAPLEESDRVRGMVDVDVAAVLEVPELPVDQRHNSKIDRGRIARWAEAILAGGRMRRL